MGERKVKNKGTLSASEVGLSFNQILVLLPTIWFPLGQLVLKYIYILNFFLGGTIFNFLKIAQTSAFQLPSSGLKGDAVPIRDWAHRYVRVYTCMYCRYIHCTNSLTHIYIYYACSNDRLIFLLLFYVDFPSFPPHNVLFLLPVSESIVCEPLS